MVAIEKIKAGDKVISTDPETFETAEKTVLETYIREVSQLLHLTISGELITTTIDHPFYVKDLGFVNAGELYVGDKLLDLDGNVLMVENTVHETAKKSTKVYNFQVKDFHTYYVGGNGVLVHNAGIEYEGGSKAIKYGSDTKTETKLSNQMNKRGWTKESVQNTVDSPYTTSPSKNLATQNSATAYYNKDGSYVILDDVTNEVVQISNCNDPNWVPDTNIQNPYKPGGN